MALKRKTVVSLKDLEESVELPGLKLGKVTNEVGHGQVAPEEALVR